MPASVLIGLSAFALLSGPICGGIQWHYWNRDALPRLLGAQARAEERRRHRGRERERDGLNLSGGRFFFLLLFPLEHPHQQN